MALQALAKYREQSSVQLAANRALVCLSAMQNADGGFSSWGRENAESCAQVLPLRSTRWALTRTTAAS